MSKSKKTERVPTGITEYEYDANELAAFFGGKRKRIRPCKVTRYYTTREAHERFLRKIGLDPAQFPLKGDKGS